MSTSQRIPSFQGQALEVNRVEALLRKVTSTLDAAGIPYAVIGGNAVASWVSTADEGAVRATKDVDLLIRRDDLARIDSAVAPIGMARIEAMGVEVLLDSENPLPSKGVHLIFANELVRSFEIRPAPDVMDSVRAVEGYRVIGLESLMVMKLQAFRRVDQVHLEDLLRTGLVDDSMYSNLPEDLQPRLLEICRTMDWLGKSPPF